MVKDYGKYFIIIFFVELYSSPALSVENTNFLKTNNIFLSPFSFVTSISAGPSWEGAGKNQTLDLGSDVIKTYTANKPSNTLANVDLFLGIQKAITEKLYAQIGFDFATFSNATLSGDIWDDADSEFDNYTYQYKIKHTRVALKGKLLSNLEWPVQPWLSGTVGAGWNQSHAFTNTPLIYEANPTPNLSNKTVTAFTYAIGAGIQHALNKQWQIGIGYEFADWGKSNLGPVNDGTKNQCLSLSHLYTNSLLLTLTFLPKDIA